MSDNDAPITDQPPPKPNTRPAVWSLVIADMHDRDKLGRERYGTPLQPHNGRDALVDLYQELLDAVVYARQEICDRDDYLQTIERQRKEIALLRRGLMASSGVTP